MIARPSRSLHCILLALTAAVMTAALCSNAAGAQAVRAPFGVLDEVVSTDPGRILIRGWALDPADPAVMATISVTVLSPGGVTTTTYTGDANRHRPDVGRAVVPRLPPCDRWCATEQHGFAVALTEQVPGVHQVCVDAHLPQERTRLGCESVRVAWASVHDPLGALLSVDALPGAAVQVHGWVVDVDRPGEAVVVHVYALQTEPWGSAFLGFAREPCLLGPNSCLTGNPAYPRLPTPGLDAVANEALPAGVGYDGIGFHKVVDRREFTATDLQGAAQLDARLTTRVCAFAENLGPGRDALLGCRWVQLIG